MNFLIKICLLLFVSFFSAEARAETVYQSPQDFLQEVFGSDVPQPEVLSIYGERRDVLSSLLNHPPSMLRVRYWMSGDKTAWVLNEIGKTKPITTGIVVESGELKDIRVLIYRESHGSEVRHDFFTKQFYKTKLDSKRKLNKSIDGISGATLSVNALKRLAAVALFLDSEVKNIEEKGK